MSRRSHKNNESLTPHIDATMRNINRREFGKGMTAAITLLALGELGVRSVDDWAIEKYSSGGTNLVVEGGSHLLNAC